MQNYLQHEFTPTFGEDDLLNVEHYHAILETIVNVRPVPPFFHGYYKDLTKIKSMENPRIAEIIKEMSRLKYGKDEKLV